MVFSVISVRHLTIFHGAADTGGRPAAARACRLVDGGARGRVARDHARAHPYFMPFLMCDASPNRGNSSAYCSTHTDFPIRLSIFRRRRSGIARSPRRRTANDGPWSRPARFWDGHNCGWLTRLPHEALAGGNMYAFRNLGGVPGEMDMVTPKGCGRSSNASAPLIGAAGTMGRGAWDNIPQSERESAVAEIV